MKIAKEAVNKGGLYPAVLNASNEAAVNLFLNGKIAFSKIEEIILEELNQVPSIYNPNLDDILNTDIQIKEKINRKFNR